MGTAETQLTNPTNSGPGSNTVASGALDAEQQRKKETAGSGGLRSSSNSAVAAAAAGGKSNALGGARPETLGQPNNTNSDDDNSEHADRIRPLGEGGSATSNSKSAPQPQQQSNAGSSTASSSRRELTILAGGLGAVSAGETSELSKPMQFAKQYWKPAVAGLMTVCAILVCVYFPPAALFLSPAVEWLAGALGFSGMWAGLAAFTTVVAGIGALTYGVTCGLIEVGERAAVRIRDYFDPAKADAKAGAKAGAEAGAEAGDDATKRQSVHFENPAVANTTRQVIKESASASLSPTSN